MGMALQSSPIFYSKQPVNYNPYNLKGGSPPDSHRY